MPDFELHLDYDGDGRVSGTAREYALRGNGLVVLPNLDRDDRVRPPVPGAAPPPRVELDGERRVAGRGDGELVPAVVRRRLPAGGPAPDVYLRAGQGLTPLLGVYDETRTRIAPTRDDLFPVPPARAGETRLFLDLTTVPYGFAFNGTELEVSLVIRTGRGPLTVVDTTVLHLPGLVLSGDFGRPLEVFVADVPESVGLGNAPALTGLRRAARAAGVPVVAVPFRATNGDVWLQDQLQFAHLRRGRDVLPVVLHLPRVMPQLVYDLYADDLEQVAPNLEQFVDGYFPSRDLAVYRGFHAERYRYTDERGQPAELGIHEAFTAYLQLSRVVSMRDDLRTIVMTLRRIEQGAGSAVALLPEPDEGETLPDALLREIPELVARLRRLTALRLHPLYERGEELADLFHRSVRRRLLAGPPRAYLVRLTTGSTGTRDVLIELGSLDEFYAAVNRTVNSLNYGGNVELTPPRAPGEAPTVVVGVDSQRPMGAALGDVLYGSGGRGGVLELDTSWLAVGHVDEAVAFVPDHVAGSGFGAFFASPELAVDLVRAAYDRYRAGVTDRTNPEWLANQPYRAPPADPAGPQPLSYVLGGIPQWNLPQRDLPTASGTAPVTRMLRGKRYERVRNHGETSYQAAGYFNGTMSMLSRNNLYLYDKHEIPIPPSNSMSPVYDYFARTIPHYPAAISVRALLQVDALVVEGNPAARDGSYSRGMEVPVRRNVERVRARFPGVRVEALPVLFDVALRVTGAYTPNLVNLQQLGRHVVVPRPYGPRMAAADAIAVVQQVARARAGGRLPPHFDTRVLTRRIRRDRLDLTVAWANAQQGDTLENVVATFGDGFPGVPEAEVARRIRAANPGAFLGNGTLRSGWRELRIPESTVDVFELYAHTVLEQLGVVVHWVDSWFYHTRSGELHCGTNVLRAP